MRDFLRRLLQGKYVGLLEADIARLRAENRALTNSLLGTAGFPPVDFPAETKPQALPRLRKRSWHQIQAWRESGASRDAAENRAEIELTGANGSAPKS
jgi:hypothetical protein